MRPRDAHHELRGEAAPPQEPAEHERVIDDVLLEAEHIEELMFEHSGFEARRVALLSTIGNGLATAMQDEAQREPALIAFLVTASGLTLWGVGSAFWGVVGGVLALAAQRVARRG